jgi:hypothetical protein
MSVKMAMAMLLSLAPCQSVYAAPPSDRCGAAGEASPSSDGLVCRHDLPLLQSEPGSARNSHRAILRQIAIYVSMGNREGAEILIAQLRSQRLSEDLLNEAVTWMKLHDSPLRRGTNTEHLLP